jgi:hypothetical protein
VVYIAAIRHGQVVEVIRKGWCCEVKAVEGSRSLGAAEAFEREGDRRATIDRVTRGGSVGRILVWYMLYQGGRCT